MPEYSYPHVRHAGDRTPFGSAGELSEAVKDLAGEHISIEFRRASGIVSSLFFTVNDDGTLSASYGSLGFPMGKPNAVSCDDVASFLKASG